MKGMLGIGSIIIVCCDGIQTPLLNRRSEKQIAGVSFAVRRSIRGNC